MKFQTPYRVEKPIGESNFGISLTVPDQSMSISELVRRTRAGLPLTGSRVPQYNEDDDFTMDPHFLDTIDKLEMALDNREHLEELRQAASAEYNGNRKKSYDAFKAKLQAERDELARLRALHLESKGDNRTTSERT